MEPDAAAVTVFLKVAAHRSFRGAAAELGISPSAVSQTIKALEARLGTALFSRTTRSVALTEAGALLLARAGPAMESLRQSFDEVVRHAGRPSGLLRLNASRGVIPFLLQPVQRFCTLFPEVEVELFADDGLVDIVEERFDAGVRLGERLAPGMVALRISPPFQFVVAGSREYIDRAGAPSLPSDLSDHDCVRFRRVGSMHLTPWLFRAGADQFEVSVSGNLIVNDTTILVGAAIAGMGLVHVPEPVIRDHIASGRLIAYFAGDQAFQSPGLFLYFPKRNAMSPKLRAFVDFIKRERFG